MPAGTDPSQAKKKQQQEAESLTGCFLLLFCILGDDW
jgi:hypothetical protein